MVPEISSAEIIQQYLFALQPHFLSARTKSTNSQPRTIFAGVFLCEIFFILFTSFYSWSIKLFSTLHGAEIYYTSGSRNDESNRNQLKRLPATRKNVKLRVGLCKICHFPPICPRKFFPTVRICSFCCYLFAFFTEHFQLILIDYHVSPAMWMRAGFVYYTIALRINWGNSDSDSD